MSEKHGSQIIGNIGMYYVCFRLSQEGWNVMPTARNARGVDIIAYTGDARAFIGVQVKALSKRNPVPLGKEIKNLMGDWWVIVNNVNLPARSAFSMRPDEVRNAAHRGEKDGKVSYWLQPKAYDQNHYRERWDRLEIDKNF